MAGTTYLWKIDRFSVDNTTSSGNTAATETSGRIVSTGRQFGGLGEGFDVTTLSGGDSGRMNHNQNYLVGDRVMKWVNYEYSQSTGTPVSQQFLGTMGGTMTVEWNNGTTTTVGANGSPNFYLYRYRDIKTNEQFMGMAFTNQAQANLWKALIDNNPNRNGIKAISWKQQADGAFGSSLTHGAAAVCFAGGTMIECVGGAKPVEQIREDDKIIDARGETRVVRWRTSTLKPGIGNSAPVRIRKGTLGATNHLFVSQQHRVLVHEPKTGFLAAKHLVGKEGIEIVPTPLVEYHHILLDRHAAISADGVWCESLHMGPMALGMLSKHQLEDLQTSKPELYARRESYKLAYPELRKHDLREIARVTPTAAAGFQRHGVGRHTAATTPRG